jgi:hypothetical protein
VLCLTCGRVRPAARATEYTLRRALLIEERGLCVCLPADEPADGAPPTEDVALPETDPAR